MMHYGWYPTRFGYGSLEGWLSFIIFWLAVAFLIAVIVKVFSGKGGRIMHDKGSDKPLDILKKRYAKGEIDKKEFEQMKKDLS